MRRLAVIAVCIVFAASGCSPSPADIASLNLPQGIPATIKADSAAPSVTLSYYDVAPKTSQAEYYARGLAIGSDGNVWFDVTTQNYMSSEFLRVSPSGTVLGSYPLSGSCAGQLNCRGVVAGPDTAIWFTYTVPLAPYGRSWKIGRLSTATGTLGQLSKYSVARVFSSTYGTSAMTVGSDGAVWALENRPNLARTATGGASGPVGKSSQFAIHFSHQVAQFDPPIVSGPDGALWYSLPAVPPPSGPKCSIPYVGRTTTSGATTTYAIPPGRFGPGCDGVLLASGSDGNVWYADDYNYDFCRMTTAGVTKKCYFYGNTFWGKIDSNFDLTVGSDGAFWGITHNGYCQNYLVRVTTSGSFSSYRLKGVFPTAIVKGGANDLWIADQDQAGECNSGGGESAGLVHAVL